MRDLAAILVRLDPELKARAEVAARESDRSLNKWIISVIRKAVKEQRNG